MKLTPRQRLEVVNDLIEHANRVGSVPNILAHLEREKAEIEKDIIALENVSVVAYGG